MSPRVVLLYFCVLPLVSPWFGWHPLVSRVGLRVVFIVLHVCDPLSLFYSPLLYFVSLFRLALAFTVRV
jgi:hypothetical protein